MQDSKNTGFTLIEMLVVLVLIALLAGLVGPRLFQKVGSAKVKVAQAQIELLSSALDTYRLDVGSYPTTEQGLTALRVEPEGIKHWDGSYLAKDVPLDPWEIAYIYLRPGKEGPYALNSLGLDAEPGGEDENQDVGLF